MKKTIAALFISLIMFLLPTNANADLIQVSTVKEALEVIKNARRGFLVEGMYRNGDVYYYGVGV